MLGATDISPLAQQNQNTSPMVAEAWEMFHSSRAGGTPTPSGGLGVNSSISLP